MKKIEIAEKALKAVYLKHVLSDDQYGWSEISDIVFNALCEIMGDCQFVDWLREERKLEK